MTLQVSQTVQASQPFQADHMSLLGIITGSAAAVLPIYDDKDEADVWMIMIPIQLRQHQL